MKLNYFKKEGTAGPSGTRSVCHARRAPPARPGPAAAPGRSAPGWSGPPQRPRKGGGEGCGAAVRGAASPRRGPGRAGTGPGDGPAATTGAGKAGRLNIAWQESLPAGWPRLVFCLVGFFSLLFWGFVVFKIEGFTVTAFHHSSVLLRPGQQGTREASGPRRAPLPLHKAHGSTSTEAAAGSSGTSACPRLPKQTFPGSSPHPPPAPCAR